MGGSVALVQLEPGTLFARDYRVISLLSQGGMGAVYLVEQQSTGAKRALKIMLPQIVSNARHRRRFAQEARIGARIESDHVVQVIGAGVDAASGTPWLAMELLRGEDLGSLVAERGPLPADEVGAILQQLCHALGAAHRVGIVHRDLKPENVFLSAARRANARSEVKILDFGIAKLIAEAFTSGTSNLGSPMWMSPEQTNQGDPVGPPADIWALGLLTFYLLTGVFFWHAANTDAPLGALLREVVLKDIPPASRRACEYGVEERLPPRFDEWFARCVNRDPGARFEDASLAYAVFWAILREPVAPVSPLEDDSTAVDFSDQTTTLSSIPPAAPQDPDEPEEITIDDPPREAVVRRRLEPPEPPLPAVQPEVARRRGKLETGAGTSRPTPSPRTSIGRAGWLAGAVTTAGLAVFCAYLVTLRPHSDPPAPPAVSSEPPPEPLPPVAPFVPRRIPIPAGSFAPGALEGTGGDRTKVMIDAFALDEREVTVADWLACVAGKGCPSIAEAAARTSPECNVTRRERLDHPVNCVTWFEASAFCTWALGRLPREEEWEYAAAAGREGRVNLYPWGAEVNAQNANGQGDEDGFLFTAPVGRFPRGASEFKVVDMAGNVEEWTASAYATARAMAGVSTPEDADRVTRGGGYASDLRALRTSARGRAAPGLRSPTLGFRCASASE